MLFRIFSLCTLILSAAASVLAQDPVPGPDNVMFFSRATQALVPDEAIKDVQLALNLSDVQVTAVKTLANMRMQATQQIGREAAAAQMKLHELAGQTNPNATEVGTAFLATQSVQAKFRAASEKFQTDFQALLSAEQRAKLAALKTASSQVESLRRLGVLDGPMGVFTAPAFMEGSGFGGVGGVRVEGPIRIQRGPAQ